MTNDSTVKLDGALNEDAFFTRLLQQTTNCVTALHIVHGQVNYRLLAGQAVYGDGQARQIAADTRFNCGSVTKIITGALITKLVETGELLVTDPVQRYLPVFPDDRITIYHLLTHSGGYDGLSGVGWFEQDWRDSDHYIDEICRQGKLLGKIGEASEYYTQGYVLLMGIIERISGLTLEQYARQVLFGPLEMHDTTYEPATLDADQVVYPVESASARVMDEFGGLVPTGDSGLYTTADDLAKFGQMLLAHGLYRDRVVFSRLAVQWMLNDVPDKPFRRTPIFWKRTDRDRFGCFGDFHSEAAVGHPGFSGCIMTVDPVYQSVIVMLTNSTKLHEDWGNYKRMNNVLLAGIK